MSQLAEDLKAVRELLAVPERWTQGAYCDNNQDGTVCRCLKGAVIIAVVDYRRLVAAQNALIAELPISNIIIWNDDPSRTHAEVLAVIDRAIANAEVSSMITIRLTRRQASVYPLLFTSLSFTEIAKKVGVSVHVVAVTTSRICDRYRLNGRVELMAHYIAELKANHGIPVSPLVEDVRKACAGEALTA